MICHKTQTTSSQPTNTKITAFGANFLHKNEHFFVVLKSVEFQLTHVNTDSNKSEHSVFIIIKRNMKNCCILTSDPAKLAIPKTVEVAYSIGVGELGWKYGIWLKSHGTVTNWCTGREWPVNYMTVISARWRSNTPF